MQFHRPSPDDDRKWSLIERLIEDAARLDADLCTPNFRHFDGDLKDLRHDVQLARAYGVIRRRRCGAGRVAGAREPCGSHRQGSSPVALPSSHAPARTVAGVPACIWGPVRPLNGGRDE